MGRNWKSTILGHLLPAVLFTAPLLAAEGFGGRIFFREGGSVAFVHLGTPEVVHEYAVAGAIGAQRVRYELADLSQIVFEEKSKSAIIVSKGGDRFTVTDARLTLTHKFLTKRGERQYRGRTLSYVYNDPVTRRLMGSAASTWSKISHVSIEGDAGDVKRNPSTGEVFPAMYAFDPFTGEKLEWAKSGADR